MRASTQNGFKWAGYGFTAIDAGMTAGFGVMFAISSGMWWAAGIYGPGLGLGSVILAFLPVVAFACFMSPFLAFRCIGGLLVVVYLGGYGLNMMSNFGFTASVAQSGITNAANQNQIAGDHRAKIDRYRKTIASANEVIQAPGAWNTSNSLRTLIVDTEAAQARESKRKFCGRKCEALAAKVRALRDDLGKSVAREKAIATRDKTEPLLAAAEKLSETKGNKSTSVANSQANFLSTILSGKLKPEGNTVDWTVIYASMAISNFISIFAHLCNLVPAMNLAGVRDEPDKEKKARQPWLPSPSDHPPQPLYSEPIPMGASPPPPGFQMSMTSNDSSAASIDRMKESFETLKRVAERGRSRRASA